MIDLAAWLRSLGLEHYEAAFRENAIDDTVLLNLTAEDLKDLGVGLVGHRRKLLDAIADLRAQGGAKVSSPHDLPTVDKPSKDSAERRQVTVMFSDLVGSTALAARMDPEDLRELISSYQKCVAENVRRFGGFVAKYMGDGVLVYFGYPQAHEDDAERAVRAGLQLIGAVTSLETRTSLQARVGIATGLVVVGDLIGSGEAQERGIVGETPNLAARLQGIAEPNMVVIDASTRRLIGELFELQHLGPKDLKGISGPARAWAALGARSVESRFEAMHGSGSGLGSPRKLARIADGPARPTWPCEGGGADRGDNRARVLPCRAGRRRAHVGSGALIGARPSHCRWFTVPAGHAAACDLFVQACAGPGRRLWDTVAWAEKSAARPYRRSAGEPIRGHCR